MPPHPRPIASHVAMGPTGRNSEHPVGEEGEMAKILPVSTKRLVTFVAFAATCAAASACTVLGLRPSASAAVFGGTAVGATAVNRVVTGDCWSSCPYGGICDHATGMCVYPSSQQPEGVPGEAPLDAASDAGALVD